MFSAAHDKKPEQYFKDAQSWDQEIYAGLHSSKNRAWMITLFCMGITALSMLALILLLPLKSFEPYVLSVDRQTGYIEATRGLYAGNLSEDEAITQSHLVRYIAARESYNPSVLRENYDFVVLLSEGSALKEFQKLWNAQNPDNPSVRFGKSAAIDIKIKSVSLLNSKTATVRFMRELHENDQIHISHWSAIIDFHYVEKPMKMADRFSNPLGFKVIRYRINPEGLETVK